MATSVTVGVKLNNFLHISLTFCCTVQIKDQLQHDSNRNHCVTEMNQLLIALRFYATGTFQLVVGDLFGVDRSTVCRILHRVTHAIASLRSKYVKWPTAADELRDIMNSFFTASRMPGVIGAIDCTHVPIQSPGGDDPEIYRNRKGYFSINVQLTCDRTGYITDVVARWPGSVHDSTIFDHSHIRALLETTHTDGYLVGDGGYPCRRYLLTPVTNPVTRAEAAYNVAHITARNPIERVNGVLKRRFAALKYGLRLRLENILPVIVATVVLHNIAVVLADEMPPDDEELETFMMHARRQDMLAVYDEEDVVPPADPIRPAGTSMRQAVIHNHFT